jgi:hypothetical protein
MRTSDVDILIVPGSNRLDSDHWQSRWLRHFKTAALIEPPKATSAGLDDWTRRIAAASNVGERQAVLVAHGLGVLAAVAATPRLGGSRTVGAFLVAPADPEGPVRLALAAARAARMPLEPLPFASVLIASGNDPLCRLERAEAFAAAWGSELSTLAEAGSIDAKSGHGPWPDGLLRFGQFLRGLSERPASA